MLSTFQTPSTAPQIPSVFLPEVEVEPEVRNPIWDYLGSI
jgi:hypothetical protein